MQNHSKLPDTRQVLKLTVIITVVSGKESMRNCLTALYPQVDFSNSEIIIPFDKWSQDIEGLATEFPLIRFHFIEELGLAENTNITAHEHRLYDRRRAIGLQIAKGQIIAMTEDHAIPATDWVEQILLAHENKAKEVIGGAIENGIDTPLNWAWYYCDFGRYGRPFKKDEINYVSDVNVSYKRNALDSVREVWQEAYHETILHWTLLEKGTELFLYENIVVFQHRPKVSFSKAFSERIAWGRVFGETRVATCSFPQRLMFSAGTLVLPLLLLSRVFGNMIRQKRTFKQIILSLPIAFLLLIGWSLGELLGYIFDLPNEFEKEPISKEIASSVSL